MDYYNHTGLDFKLKPQAEDNNVYAIKEGIVIKIIKNNGEDKGMGNTVILEHQIGGELVYSLYAHLSEIQSSLFEGKEVRGGEIIGKMGASGYGCPNYWRLEQNGCDSNTPLNEHLHLEIKKKPVLYNPFKDKICFNKKENNWDYCYGLAPHPLFDKGYLNPLNFLYEQE